MPKYAIFLDLDGTTLETDNTLTERTKTTVQKISDLGHKIFIATGRQYYSAAPFHRALNLTTPLITLNGGALYDKKGTLVHKRQLSSKFIQYLLDHPSFIDQSNITFFEAPNQTISTNDNLSLNAFFHAQMPKNHQPNIAVCKANSANFSTFGDAINVYSFVDQQHLCQTQQTIETYWQDHAQDVDYRVENDRVSFCEFFPKDMSKATGIQHLIDSYDLAGYRTMAFGDGLNDREMLAYVDHGVMMSNGNQTLKDVSQDVTTFSHDQNGVADYLENFFL